MKVIKTIELSYLDETSDKIWGAKLFENDDVYCYWGRYNPDNIYQSKLFPKAGESFLEKKMNSKLKKGYEIV